MFYDNLVVKKKAPLVSADNGVWVVGYRSWDCACIQGGEMVRLIQRVNQKETKRERKKEETDQRP